MLPAAYSGYDTTLAYAEESASTGDDELAIPAEDDDLPPAGDDELAAPAEESEQPPASDDELFPVEEDELASTGDDELSPANESEFAASTGEGAFTVLAVDEVTVGASKDYATPQAAISAVGNNGGQPWTMVLHEDFTIGQLTVSTGTSVTITSDSSGPAHTLTASPDNRHILIQPDASVTLRDVVLTGGYPTSSGPNPEVYQLGASILVQGGTLTMESGTTIKDNGQIISQTGTWLGGAVAVISPNANQIAHFYLKGGTLSGNASNQGGAIAVGHPNPGPPPYFSAHVTMTGGTISGNSAENYGGGVIVGPAGTFTMTGGEISGNEVTRDADAVGGGVAVVYGGAFALNGGLISGNSSAKYGGGVASVYTSNVIMNGGQISNNFAKGDGGGVVVAFDFGNDRSRFTMNGGTIFGNRSDASGGGVALGQESIFTMAEGKIAGNQAAASGGGVALGQASAFAMTGGEISGNEAAVFGGGVSVEGVLRAHGYFYLESGTISDNSATDGGGVAVKGQGAQLTIISATISDNNASKDGGGIWYGDGGKINLDVSDAVAFAGNSAQKLYLPDAEPQPVTDNRFVGTVSSLSSDFTSLGYPANYPYENQNTILAFNNYDILGTGYGFVRVTFDATGGSFADGTGSTFVDVWPSRTLGNRMPVPPERADWTFIGWATSPGDQIPNFSGKTVVSASLTVYALWGHRVTYHGQGNTSGSVPQDTKIYANGATVDVAAAGDLEKAGYHFVGWSTNPADTTALYQPGDSFTIVRNTDLYAVWQLAESTSLPATGDNSTLIGLLAGVVLVLAVVCIGRGLRPMRGPGARGIGLHSRVA